MQIIDYNDVTNFLVSQLSLANTTTAYYPLSAILSTPIVTITRDDVAVAPLKKSQYPAIGIIFTSKTEETIEVATNITNKKIELFFRLTVIQDSFINSKAELQKIISNIEANLRYNINISNYKKNGFKVTCGIPKDIKFLSNVNGDSAFNKTAEIQYSILGHLKNA